MSLLDVVEAAAPIPSLAPTPAPSAPSNAATPFQLRGSDAEKIKTALKLLRDARLSPVTLFEEILTNPEYDYHAVHFFGKSGASMRRILDAMTANSRGEEIFKAWVFPRVIDIACEAVSAQMDAMVKALSTAKSISKLTPEFLRAWTVNKNIVQPADKVATDVVKILSSAINTQRGLSKNKKKTSDTVCLFASSNHTVF